MCRDLENIIIQESQRNMSQNENEVPETHKLTKFEVKNDKMCCKDCTKSLCLDIQKKISIINRLHTLVRTLNMNEDGNKEKLNMAFWPISSEN